MNDSVTVFLLQYKNAEREKTMIRRIGKIWNLLRPGGKPPAQEIIGIIGMGRSVGVTHFAVMTAGYLTGVLHKRCAVLEWNNHGDFRNMRMICKKEAGQSEISRILDVDYYEQAGINTLLMCKKFGYDVVIVDYGSVTEENLKEFLRCDRQFALASFSEWQVGIFLEFERREKEAKGSWETLAAFGSEEARTNMEKRLGFSVRRIPFSPDAFAVTGEVMNFYQRYFG